MSELQDKKNGYFFVTLPKGICANLGPAHRIYISEEDRIKFTEIGVSSARGYIKELYGVSVNVKLFYDGLNVMSCSGKELDFSKYSYYTLLVDVANIKYLQMNKDIVQLEAERLVWSKEIFPEATPISSLRKLETEIKEIESDIEAGIRRPEEYADALMCLFDSAGRQGIFPSEIFVEYAKKLEVNKNRKWVKNPDNSYSHVK